MTFSKTVLPSGLRVVIAPIKDHPTVTVMVLVEAGSKYERKEINGISHFLEHMCFKGTEKRKSALDITRELDTLGAQYNAFTSHEFTGYFAKCAFKHFDTALDVVSDIYLHSKLPEADVQKEKGVVIEEINMYEDLPQRKVQELFSSLLYGDTPAGWDIAGTKEIVSSFTRQQLIDYRSQHYVADSTVVVIAGNIDAAQALEKVTDTFSVARQGAKGQKEKVVEQQASPAARIFHKETDQAHFVVGVRTFDVYDPRNPILRVLSAVLGGGMSSRLFQKVRDEMGAAYYVGASNDSFTDHGYFQVAAGVDQRRVKDVLAAVLGEMQRLKNEEVSAEELKKAKEHLIGTMYLSLETSDALADIYGYQEILRKPIRTPDETRDLISKVKANDLRELANEVFVSPHLNFTLVGRFKDAGEFLPLLAV